MDDGKERRIRCGLVEFCSFHCTFYAVQPSCFTPLHHGGQRKGCGLEEGVKVKRRGTGQRKGWGQKKGWDQRKGWDQKKGVGSEEGVGFRGRDGGTCMHLCYSTCKFLMAEKRVGSEEGVGSEKGVWIIRRVGDPK